LRPLRRLGLGEPILLDKAGNRAGEAMTAK